MKRAALFVALVAAITVIAAGPASAGPHKSRSPNLEEPFDVVCNGTPLTLVDAPANGEHAEFTPAFVTTSHQVVVPFIFDATQSVTLLSEEAVFDGETYHAGDVVFSGSEVSGHGTARKSDATCTFGGTEAAVFEDDNGQLVDVRFDFSGTAVVKLPNTK